MRSRQVWPQLPTKTDVSTRMLHRGVGEGLGAAGDVKLASEFDVIVRNDFPAEPFGCRFERAPRPPRYIGSRHEFNHSSRARGSRGIHIQKNESTARTDAR